MKNSIYRILPVLFGFFVMGFCDVAGIATSYVKQDFGLSETMAGFIPSMVFIWFLVLSVPAAVWMNRLGRKRMVQISNAVTFAGMLIPFIHYSYATCMAGFVFLGVGNTILQVSLHPLLTNVVSGCIGFFCSSIFPVIYGQAIKHRPDKANEISGLMIMGVCGGAAIPPAMGPLRMSWVARPALSL